MNLYTVTALEPANRKSQVFSHVCAPLVQFDREEAEKWMPVVEENRHERDILELRIKHLKQNLAKNGEGEEGRQTRKALEEAVEKLSRTPQLVVPRYLADDVTPERLASLMFENGGKQVVMSPEGGIFDLMAGRYSTAAPNLDVFLKGHAGDDIRVDRVSKDRPPEFIIRPALSMALTVQPVVLRGLISQPSFRGRGLLGRFLYAVPETLLGRRKINPEPVPPEITQKFTDRIHTALRLQPVIDANGRHVPHVITFSPSALLQLDDFIRYVEKGLADNGEFASMRDWAGKLVGAVCRIAGIFHGLMYAHTGNPVATQIEEETVQGAIEIGRYLIPHAKAAYFAMGSDPSIDLARKLLNWLTASERKEFTKRDAYQIFRGIVHAVDDLDDPLSLLERHGYIRPVDRGHTGRGRKPSPRYEINPLIPALNTHNTQNSPSSPNSVYCVYSVQENESENATEDHTGEEGPAGGKSDSSEQNDDGLEDV